MNPWNETLSDEQRTRGLARLKTDPDLLDYACGDEEFALWLREVNFGVFRAIGFDFRDLADFPSRDLYDDGLHPHEAVQACLAYNDLSDLLEA